MKKSTLNFWRVSISLLLGGWVGLFGSLPAQCISTFPYFENFDNGPGGWVSSLPGQDGFNLGTPGKAIVDSAHSAPNAWVSGLLTSNAHNNFDAHIESPCFDFSNLTNPSVSLKVWWECEFSKDGGALMYSTDGGNSWTRVGQAFDPFNWYSDNSINSAPCSQTMGWSGRQSQGQGSVGWVSAQSSLSFLAGESDVRFRLCYSTDIANSFDGIAYDDFAIAETPTVDLGNDTTLCFADTVILNACLPGGVSYRWNNGAASQQCQRPAFITGLYFVEAVDSLGFVARDSIQVSVSPTFVNLGPDQLICPGDTLTLNAGNPNANHLWQPSGSTSQTIEVFASGTYRVMVSDGIGCVERDSINIAVDVVPDVDLGPDTTICVGGTLSLDAGAANPGTTYDWSFGSTSTQTIVVSAPDTYWVQVTTGAGCLASDTMSLDVKLSPVVSLGPDRAECNTFTLNAGNPGSSYIWNNNTTNQVITTAIPGTYWVEVTNIFGCSKSDTVTITPGVVPVVDLGPDAIICDGTNLVLDAGNPGSRYLWSTGDTTQTTNALTGGTYRVRVTSQDGCIDRDTIMVVRTPLTVDLGPDLFLCEGDTTTLFAGNSGTSYVWNTNDTGNSLQINSGGTYIVNATDDQGCQASDTVVIDTQLPMNPGITLPDSAELFETVDFTDATQGVVSSWRWDFGDGSPVTNQQNPSHAFQSIGTFNVCLTVTEGVCVRRVCEEIVVTIFTDTEAPVGWDLKAYPNPGSGTLKLDLDLLQSSPLRWTLTDLSGRTLKQGDAPRALSHRLELPAMGLPAGMYLLRVEAAGHEQWLRIERTR